MMEKDAMYAMNMAGYVCYWEQIYLDDHRSSLAYSNSASRGILDDE